MKRRTECRASAARNELESIRRAAHRKPRCRECAGARNRDPARQLARHAAAILARAENVRAVRMMEFHPRSHLAKNGLRMLRERQAGRFLKMARAKHQNMQICRTAGERMRDRLPRIVLRE